jgi:hypothetical protein
MEKKAQMYQEQSNTSDSEYNFELSDLLLNKLRNAIEGKNHEEYEKLLKLIPLKNIPYEQTNKLFLILLNWIESVHFTQGLKQTLTYWSGMETGFDEYYGEIYPILPTLFLDETFPFPTLFYIMDVLRDVVSIEEIAIDLFEKGSGDALDMALKKLFDMLGTPSGELFRILTNEAINSGNDRAIMFMNNIQGYYREPAPIPDYIEIDEEGLDPEEDVLLICEGIAQQIYDTNEIPYTNIDYCVEFLSSGLADLDRYGLQVVDIESIRQQIREKLSGLTDDERRDYMNRFINQESMNQLVDDGELSLILGPANPLINGDFKKTNHICYHYGGCRMLYCNCFEFEQMDFGAEELEIKFPNIPQWFKGECEKCKRFIKKRCYAIRRPLPQGGWRGTYCSWNCLYLSGNADDRMSRELCSIAEEKINTFKIMDREEMDVEKVLKEKEDELLAQEANDG